MAVVHQVFLNRSTAIASALSNFKIEQSGFVYLADKNGLVKVHPNRELVETYKCK